jgi:hypothetical protein
MLNCNKIKKVFLAHIDNEIYWRFLNPRFQSIELLHAFVTPYTFMKNFTLLSRGQDVKQIVSANPLKKVKR